MKNNDKEKSGYSFILYYYVILILLVMMLGGERDCEYGFRMVKKDAAEDQKGLERRKGHETQMAKVGCKKSINCRGSGCVADGHRVM